MNPYQVGTLTEFRFFNATEVRTDQTPVWFLGIRRAPPLYDLQGIDGFAYIRSPERTRLRVPIQIKSSWEGRDHFLEIHPELDEAGVVVIVIPKKFSDDQIRERLYGYLEEIRLSGRSYNRLLKELRTIEITKLRQRKLQQIRAQREEVYAGYS